MTKLTIEDSVIDYLRIIGAKCFKCGLLFSKNSGCKSGCTIVSNAVSPTVLPNLKVINTGGSDGGGKAFNIALLRVEKNKYLRKEWYNKWGEQLDWQLLGVK